MSDYKEAQVSGKKWQRAKYINITNERDKAPSITFIEEELIDIGDGEIVSRHIPKVLEKEFTTENSDTSFALMNTETNTAVKDSTMTYGELYTALYSLYFHLADARDNMTP